MRDGGGLENLDDHPAHPALCRMSSAPEAGRVARRRRWAAGRGGQGPSRWRSHRARLILRKRESRPGPWFVRCDP